MHIALSSLSKTTTNFQSDTLLFLFSSSDYGTSDKAKSISLKVLNKDNCREVIDINKEREKTKAKEEEKTKAKEGRTEQVFEVKRSTGGLYPDLSLLKDN